MSLLRNRRSIFILLALVILVFAALFLGLRKTVTLNVDGESQAITTYALKVSGLLPSQGIPLSPQDKLSPSVDTWLKKGATVTLVHAIPVQVLADDKIFSLLSPERVPSELLKQAGISLLPGDQLLSNGRSVLPNQSFPASARSISLQVVRSVEFTLNDNGLVVHVASTASSLGSALIEAGFSLFAADQLVPPPYTPLSPGLAASLARSRPITIQTQAGDMTIRTAARTVGDALVSARLSLQGLDYSLPAPDSPIPASGLMRLVHVTEQVLIEQTPVKFETQFQPVPDLELDSQSILQPGAYGVTAQRVRVRYEDGKEASRQADSEWVALQPQPRIIGYGTNVVMHTTTVDGVQIQYWRTLQMYATSYHPSEVGDTTASGMPLKKGVAAIDRSIVPFYTMMYIPGYGEAVAADIGGGVIGRWIDLGYSDNDYVPWHQWVTVYFLWPPPANIVWVVP